MKEGDKVIFTRKQGDKEQVYIRFINPKDPDKIEVFFPSTQESWWVSRKKLTPLQSDAETTA